MVFQDPFSSLSPRMSIGEIIAEGLEVHGLSKGQERTKMVSQALLEVGLDPQDQHRYPHEFSGGQRQRIAIARALILSPKLMILDEPTSALDRSIQTQILSLLLGLQERHGLSYLLISHDLRVIRAMSHEVAILQQGRIVEYGPSEQIFRSPAHAATKMLLDSLLF